MEENKDLTLVQEKTAGDGMLAKLEACTVTSQEQASILKTLLEEAKTRGKKVEDHRKKLTKGLNETLDTINKEHFDLFKEGEKVPTSLYGRIITACKTKLLAWDQAQLRKYEEEQARIKAADKKKEDDAKEKLLKKAEKAEAQGKTELASELVEQAANVQTFTTVVAPPTKNVGSQNRWTYEITDFSKLPDKYKQENGKMIQGVVVAEKAMCDIPGIRVFQTSSPVAR